MNRIVPWAEGGDPDYVIACAPGPFNWSPFRCRSDTLDGQFQGQSTHPPALHRSYPSAVLLSRERMKPPVPMSTTSHEFELPNVAAGPDPFELSAVATRDDVDALVLLFQRDYHCVRCRRQVQAVADRYDEFEAADAEVASVLPEPPEKAADWQDRYDLPYPLLADPSKAVADEFDQPTRFGALGSLHDLVGRMPLAVVFDVRDGEPTVEAVREGSTPGDRPDVDDLLAAVDDLEEAIL